LTGPALCGNYSAQVSQYPVAAGGHSAWLLELGAAARADAERPVLRKGHLGPWSSRRARARSRRAMIRERLETVEVGVEVDFEAESIDDTLVDRLSVYTHEHALSVYTHEHAQPATMTSLLATATGPGSAWATTQTENR